MGLVLAATALGASRAIAADVPPPIYPLRDDARILDAAAADEVRRICRGLERDTSAEIGVLTLATTAGEQHHAYAVRVFNAWGVGKRGRDNGVLLVFAMADRRVELVTGDAFADLFDGERATALLERVVIPRMRAGKPAEAVQAAAAEVARLIREREGRPEAPSARPATGPQGTTVAALEAEAATPTAAPLGFGGGSTRKSSAALSAAPPGPPPRPGLNISRG